MEHYWSFGVFFRCIAKHTKRETVQLTTIFIDRLVNDYDDFLVSNPYEKELKLATTRTAPYTWLSSGFPKTPAKILTTPYQFKTDFIFKGFLSSFIESEIVPYNNETTSKNLCDELCNLINKEIYIHKDTTLDNLTDIWKIKGDDIKFIITAFIDILENRISLPPSEDWIDNEIRDVSESILISAFSSNCLISENNDLDKITNYDILLHTSDNLEIGLKNLVNKKRIFSKYSYIRDYFHALLRKMKNDKYKMRILFHCLTSLDGEYFYDNLQELVPYFIEIIDLYHHTVITFCQDDEKFNILSYKTHGFNDDDYFMMLLLEEKLRSPEISSRIDFNI
ncbi:hypothetical protein [Pseudolactococcus chungangensis]|uniref:hypothetical protein n=1 Tax=Pseudolactococcus chungangensis TaxID=451457 RepID=UPI0028D70260|nr:hypothetical protein [Lactococcus chungangensis]